MKNTIKKIFLLNWHILICFFLLPFVLADLNNMVTWVVFNLADIFPITFIISPLSVSKNNDFLLGNPDKLLKP